MSNIPVVPENIVDALHMRKRTLRTPVSFDAGSVETSKAVRDSNILAEAARIMQQNGKYN